MEMIDTRIYDDIFLLAKIFKRTELNKDEKERLYKHFRKRKKGEWIKMSDADGTYWCCSECGEELYRSLSFNREYDLFPKKASIDKTNFCPNCGADMRGEQDG